MVDERILHNPLSRYGGYSCRKKSEKIKISSRINLGFLSAEGVRGNFPLQAFFQVSVLGKVGKNEPVFPHRQCLLFFPEKEKAFSDIAEKIRNFFPQYPNRGDITLFTINIRNSGKGGEKNGRPRILAAQGYREYAAGGYEADCGETCGQVLCKQEVYNQRF